jgi:hypothetical protein
VWWVGHECALGPLRQRQVQAGEPGTVGGWLGQNPTFFPGGFFNIINNKFDGTTVEAGVGSSINRLNRSCGQIQAEQSTKDKKFIFQIWL